MSMRMSTRAPVGVYTEGAGGRPRAAAAAPAIKNGKTDRSTRRFFQFSIFNFQFNRQRATAMILLTGAAGFIGYHVSRRLLERGVEVVGVDNVNDYYDPALKEARLAMLRELPGFSFRRMDIADTDAMAALFAESRPARVVHLAAQAGVRYSLTNPHAYVDANLRGVMNILESCRHNGVEHLVYASSSSVYGANTKQPFSEHDNIDHPVSLYAATKKANELMAHTYAHLFGVASTGLRFFTVYGPWGRPDMALFRFTKGILAGQPIPVFNEGEMPGLDRRAEPDSDWNGSDPNPARSNAPYRIFNIGNNRPVLLLDFITA